MAVRFLLALYFCCALVSCSITRSLKTGKHLSKATSVSGSNYVHMVPFKMSTGHLLIPVTVNGETRMFYFDTGAPTAVSPTLARSLETRVLKNGKRNSGANSLDTLVSINGMRVGEAAFAGIGGVVVNTAEIFRRTCVTVDGLVGANVMNPAIWQIDYVNKRLVTADRLSNLSFISGAMSVPFVTAPFTKTPLLEVTVDNGQTVMLVYDTGFNGYATLNTADKQKFLQTPPAGRYTPLTSLGYTSILGDSVARAVDTSYVVQTNLKVGPTTLRNVPVAYGRYKNYNESKHGDIGNEFFKNAVVTLDWQNKMMYVHTTAPIDVQYSTFGFSFGMQDKKMIVGAIVPGSKAANEGVEIGDELIEINGHDVVTWTEAQRCDYVAGLLEPIPDNQFTSEFTVQKSNGELLNLSLARYNPMR